MGRQKRRQRTEVNMEEEVQQQPQQVEEEEVMAGEKVILPGMYLDIEEIETIQGTKPILDNLRELGWIRFARFSCPWYKEIVVEFYRGAVLNIDSYNNPSISFTINGVSGAITAEDFSTFFNMPITNCEIDMEMLDYPKRKWPVNWPLGIIECCEQLNNGRPQPRDINRVAASRLNLAGIQRLAFKLVIECFVPVNNKDSVLTHLQTFVTCAILNKEWINLPSLILKHMEAQKDKPILPYGMVQSHLLIQKGVDVSQYQELEVPTYSRLGKKAIPANEVYEWNGCIWSKWEIFEYFELDRRDIWKYNNCSEPAAPRGWVPCGHNRPPPNVVATDDDDDDDDEGDQRPPRLLVGSSSGPQATYESAPPPPPAPTPRRRLTDRELFESIADNVQFVREDVRHVREDLLQLRNDHERLRMHHESFVSSYGDYQWRQTAFLPQIGVQMNLSDAFDQLYVGYPTTAPAPPPEYPPADPMDHDDQGGH